MLSKNHWVITLLGIFESVGRKLQSTVSLDHPVLAGVKACLNIVPIILKLVQTKS